MKDLQIEFLTLFLVLGCAGVSLADAVPDTVRVSLPAGVSYVESTEWTGSMSSEGVDITWEVVAVGADFRADCVITGNVPCFSEFPVLLSTTWVETEETLPVSLTISSSTSIWYGYTVAMQDVPGGNMNTSLSDPIVSGGDSQFGQRFPPVNWLNVSVMVNPLIIGNCGEIDMTITMEWGPSVPSKQSSWSDVQSLYR